MAFRYSTATQLLSRFIFKTRNITKQKTKTNKTKQNKILHRMSQTKLQMAKLENWKVKMNVEHKN